MIDVSSNQIIQKQFQKNQQQIEDIQKVMKSINRQQSLQYFPINYNDKKISTTNDVSFSIPDWKQQQIKNFNQSYQKQIYQAVPLSLTDFDSKQDIQFLTQPQKCNNDLYSSSRKLVRNQDFSLLSFLICLQIILSKNQQQKTLFLDSLKKKINQLDLCVLTNIPDKMRYYHDNKLLKKILLQYINKSTYNISLLEILLRRNQMLKFSLSLVTKSILNKHGIISSYNQIIPYHLEIKNCGEEFGLLNDIKINQKYIQTQNTMIQINRQTIFIFRKQPKQKYPHQQLQQQTQPYQLQQKSKNPKKPTQTENKAKQQKNPSYYSRYGEQRNSNRFKKHHKKITRGNSLVNFIKKFICS